MVFLRHAIEGMSCLKRTQKLKQMPPLGAVRFPMTNIGFVKVSYLGKDSRSGKAPTKLDRHKQ